MGVRGRKSSASLALVSNANVELVSRPSPPRDLTVEQATVWREIVDSLAADWFRPESYPVLAQYCRHVIASRRIAEMVNAAETAETFDADAYEQALRMQDRESKAIVTLAAKMRLVQISSMRQELVKKTKLGANPWR